MFCALRSVSKSVSLAALLVASSPIVSYATDPGKTPPAAAAVAPADGAGLIEQRTTMSMIRRGDRLKFAFFEHLDIAPAPGSGGKQSHAGTPLHTFYQRMDLSGEMVVEPDGRLTVPRVGSVHVADRSVDDVKQELSVAFQRAMNRKAEVSLTIIQRSPIFVTGAVRNPGSFPFVPGMMVVHAMALAGGKLVVPTSTIEQARETERVLKATAQLRRLLARRAVLDSEVDGTPLQVPVRLISLAGEKHASEIVETEKRSLKLASEARKFEIAALTAHAESARKEFVALQRRSSDLEKQIAVRGQRMENLQKLQRAGYVSQDRTAAVSGEFADYQSRSTDFQITLIRAQQRQDDLERRILEAQLVHRRAIEKELNDIEVGISDAEQVVAASMISGIGDSKKECVQEPQVDATYEIVRRGSDRLGRLTMVESGELEPGDIVVAVERQDTKCRDRLLNINNHASALPVEGPAGSREKLLRRAVRR